MCRPDILDTSERYRRQARRIRGRYAGRPAELYRSLRQLSDRYDATTTKPLRHHEILPGSQQRTDAFAQFVADRIEGTILRYSTRLELLRVAAGLGIGRFDANLMIAAVQHQLGDLDRPAPAPGTQARWPALLTVVLIVQSGILFAAWELLAR